VLFVDGEMYPASLQERLALINQMNGDRELPAELFIISANLEEYGIPDLATVEGREAINQQITDEIDLIVLDNLSSLKLPTLFKKYILFKNGDTVPQTVDYLTSIGIVALAGDRECILSDYKKIREMESRLVVHVM